MLPQVAKEHHLCRRSTVDFTTDAAVVAAANGLSVVAAFIARRYAHQSLTADRVTLASPHNTSLNEQWRPYIKRQHQWRATRARASWHVRATAFIIFKLSGEDVCGVSEAWADGDAMVGRRDRSALGSARVDSARVSGVCVAAVVSCSLSAGTQQQCWQEVLHTSVM